MRQCSVVLAMFSPGAFNDPHTTPQAYFGDACEPSLACRPRVLSRPLRPTERSPPRATLSLHAGASRCHPCVGAPQSLSRLMRKTSGDYHYVIKRLNPRASRFRAQRSRPGEERMFFRCTQCPKKSASRMAFVQS